MGSENKGYTAKLSILVVVVGIGSAVAAWL